MGLSFPGVLSVQIIDEAGRPIIGQFAVSLRLHAHVKNDYSLLKVTAPDGKVEFTLDEVQDEICRSQRLFLMDYAASVSDCDEQVTIRILSDDEVRRAVRAHMTYQRALGISDEHVRVLEQAANHDLEPTERKVQLASKLPQVSVDVIVARKS